jgi:predicted nucleotidyltransferase
VGTPTDWDQVARRVEAVRDLARDYAARARGHFGARLRDIRLFGSAARGDWQEDSDVDVLVVLDAVQPADREWIAHHAVNLGVLGAGVVLSTVTLSEAQFRELHERERLFAREVERDGVAL